MVMNLNERKRSRSNGTASINMVGISEFSTLAPLLTMLLPIAHGSVRGPIGVLLPYYYGTHRL